VGGNHRPGRLSPGTNRKDLEEVIVRVQERNGRVVLAGMTLPPNYGALYIQQFEKMYRDLAAHYKVTLIPFLLQDLVTKDLRYLQSDGLHPTAAGNQIVAETVFRTVKPFVAAAR